MPALQTVFHKGNGQQTPRSSVPERTSCSSPVLLLPKAISLWEKEERYHIMGKL